MKKLLFILLLIFFSTDIRSQELPFYFSPGVQIGKNSGGSTYFSYQLTLGMHINQSIIFPGITFGKRRYKYKKEKKYESYTYLDGQVSFFFFGLGHGKIWKSDGESFIKSKLWVLNPIVPITFISYDYISFADKPNHHFGAFGVLPIPLEALWYRGSISEIIDSGLP